MSSFSFLTGNDGHSGLQLMVTNNRRTVTLVSVFWGRWRHELDNLAVRTPREITVSRDRDLALLNQPSTSILFRLRLATGEREADVSLGITAEGRFRSIVAHRRVSVELRTRGQAQSVEPGTVSATCEYAGPLAVFETTSRGARSRPWWQEQSNREINRRRR